MKVTIRFIPTASSCVSSASGYFIAQSIDGIKGVGRTRKAAMRDWRRARKAAATWPSIFAPKELA